MVREDARMKHVGVAQDHVRATANRTPRVLRVSPSYVNTPMSSSGHVQQPIGELVELGQLVLRQRFVGKR